MITVLQCRHHFSMSNFWHPSLRAISSPLWNSRGIVYKKSLHSFVEVISGASQPLCQLCNVHVSISSPPDQTWLAVAASHCCSLPASLPAAAAAAAAAYPAAAAPVTAPKPAQRSLNSSSSTTAARVWTSLLA